MANSPHSELISGLTELYTLLDTLAAIPPNLVRLPPHQPGAFKKDAAVAAGFTPEAVELMESIPYLNVHCNENSKRFQFIPYSDPVNYLHPGVIQVYFKCQREIYQDELMPPTAVRLTNGDLYGTDLIYDVSTRLLYPWEPSEGPEDTYDYSHVPSVKPREYLDPLIMKYRELVYIGTSERMGIDYNESGLADSGGQPPKEWAEQDQRRWPKEYAVWVAIRKLKDLYLECGWDVKTSERGDFRREEFLLKREIYLRDQVEPEVSLVNQSVDWLTRLTAC